MAWKTIALTGTKDGANTSFIIPFGYMEGTLRITHNGQEVYVKSTGSPAAGECVVMGTAVTMGLAPASTEPLLARGFEI